MKPKPSPQSNNQTVLFKSKSSDLNNFNPIEFEEEEAQLATKPHNPKFKLIKPTFSTTTRAPSTSSTSTKSHETFDDSFQLVASSLNSNNLKKIEYFHFDEEADEAVQESNIAENDDDGERLASTHQDDNNEYVQQESYHHKSTDDLNNYDENDLNSQKSLLYAKVIDNQVQVSHERSSSLVHDNSAASARSSSSSQFVSYPKSINLLLILFSVLLLLIISLLVL
jgi:hypothetical protein